MANVFLDNAHDDIFRVLTGISYPFHVEYEFLQSNFEDRFMVRCITCYDIGLSWRYVFTTKELAPYVRDHLDDVRRKLRELMMLHAQGHGNDVTQALLRKFLPQFAMPEKEYYVLPDEKWKTLQIPGRLIELEESENEI